MIASKNPVKIRAIQEAFTRVFPDEQYDFQSISVPSGVADQPFSSAETMRGAYNRAQNARALLPQADYWIGIEGGVEEEPEGFSIAGQSRSMTAFAWVVVLTNRQIGRGRTGLLFLPPRVAEIVRQGKELGEADDIIFGQTNSKQNAGAVGLLTGNIIDRAAFYEQAAILALVPFRNPELYPEISMKP